MRYSIARVNIEMLPEVALLNIFDFYLVEAHEIEAWHKLAHVCRQWRNIVFTNFLGHRVAWICNFTAQQEHR